MSSISEQLAARKAVAQAVSEIYETAERTADMCARFNVPIPDEVARLLGIGETNTKPPRPAVGHTQKRDLGPLPSPFPNLPSGFISLPVKDASLTSLLLACLRNGEAQTHGAIMEFVRSLNTGARETSLLLLYKRLDNDGIVTAAKEDGRLWVRLNDKNSAPEIRDGRLWGAAEIFQPNELAFHRREAIVIALKSLGPLLRSEIILVLSQSNWVKATVVESLIKNDLKVMEDLGVIKQARTTETNWKWELVETEGRTADVKPTATVHRIGVASR